MKVVFIGDSITWGFSATSQKESYPYIYADTISRLIGETVEVVNKSIGGNVITSLCPEYKNSVKPCGVDRVAEIVSEEKPDLTVIAFGSNDLRGGTPIQVFIQEYSRCIEFVKASSDSEIVVMGMFYFPPESFGYYPTFRRGDVKELYRYNDAIKQMCGEDNLHFCDLLPATQGKLGILDGDMLHPNNAGHTLIANRLVETVIGSIYFTEKNTKSVTKEYIDKYKNGYR